jgi:hypothetical protein
VSEITAHETEQVEQANVAGMALTLAPWFVQPEEARWPT